jgi:hypothetical protein
MVVNANDEFTAQFYEKLGFRHLGDEPLRLVLPL